MATTSSVVPFELRSETLGFDSTRPWSADALRLLFGVPRVFEPLARAWDRRRPGTLKALERLTDMGFVAYQDRIIANTVTGEVVERASRPVPRYRLTAAGDRLLRDIRSDSRALIRALPKTTPANRAGVLRLLEAADVSVSAAPHGLSGVYLRQAAGLSERTCRWWVSELIRKGLLRELPERVADAREVVPAHWRATRVLASHLREICRQRELPGAGMSLVEEYRLNRSRFLDDIVLARVGLSGATDYDHDIHTQEVLAALTRSERFLAGGLFDVEPSFRLSIDTQARPWRFDIAGDYGLVYQPDAQFREETPQGLARTVLEYERHQTRRDGWNHIERFCGWLSQAVSPYETVFLRFVVDSDNRARSYAELLAAYRDWLDRNPHLRPRQQVTLFVTSRQRIEKGEDPLHSDLWWRVRLHSGDGVAVLHPDRDTPYDAYFRVAAAGDQLDE